MGVSENSPPIWGSILRSPIFRNSHIGSAGLARQPRGCLTDEGAKSRIPYPPGLRFLPPAGVQGSRPGAAIAALPISLCMAAFIDL